MTDPTVTAYLDDALDVIAREALFADRVDWPAVRVEARRVAERTGDAHAAVEVALRALGDRHSFLRRPGQRPGYTAGGFGLRYVRGEVARVHPDGPAFLAGVRPGDRVTHVNGAPVGEGLNDRLPREGDATLRVVPYGSDTARDVRLARAPLALNRAPDGRLFGRVAWLDLPDHAGNGTLPDGRRYADVARRLIADLDAADPVGWVVDLRLNEGGNLYPMIVAAGPLLGEGELGAFVRGEARWPWSYRDGAALLGDEAVARVTGPAYRLRRPETRVAVLVSSLTGSSGEMLAFSFRGRADTRLIGEATQGLTSANDRFVLPDGAEVWLTTTLTADRAGRVYEAGVTPDEGVRTKWGALLTLDDAPLNTALAWIAAGT